MRIYDHYRAESKLSIFVLSVLNTLDTLCDMFDLPHNLSNFEFSDEQVKQLHDEFSLLIKQSTLKKCDQTVQVIANYKQQPAIYFWVMQYDNRRYRIYIGKTNSMSYRVDNYISEYQPHSPNDFKMRIFYDFMVETFRGAALDLYFRRVNLPELTQLENQAIRKFTPLLNHRNKPSQETKDKLRDAYVSYYRSSFQRMLLQDEEDVDTVNPPLS